MNLHPKLACSKNALSPAAMGPWHPTVAQRPYVDVSNKINRSRSPQWISSWTFFEPVFNNSSSRIKRVNHPQRQRRRIRRWFKILTCPLKFGTFHARGAWFMIFDERWTRDNGIQMGASTITLTTAVLNIGCHHDEHLIAMIAKEFSAWYY